MSDTAGAPDDVPQGFINTAPAAAAPAASDIKDATAAVLQRYPALDQHHWSIVDSRGKEPPGPGFQLEFYKPDAPDNPTPGKPTLEVFNKELTGKPLEDAIKGDMLHHLPAVDPKFAGLRDRFLGTMTDQQNRMNQEAYGMDKKSYGEDRPYDQWMDGSRLDAFIRGKLANQWPDDVYTPAQHKLLDQMEEHLKSAPQ